MMKTIESVCYFNNKFYIHFCKNEFDDKDDYCWGLKWQSIKKDIIGAESLTIQKVVWVQMVMMIRIRF